MKITTERLYLREMTAGDYADLAEILQNSNVMYAYEHAFSDAEVREWLDKQLRRYREDGYGLWAVIERNSGEFIGQCGLTRQDTGVGTEIEIGYLFKEKFWHRGYATEAAVGCRDYAFRKLKVHRVVSIIRDSNVASQRVAQRAGMRLMGEMVKHYYNMDMPHLIYGIRNPEVRVEDHQAVWHERFERLRELVKPLGLPLEHVGSTSVPGLAAKPVIDADLILDDWSRLDELKKSLKKLGFYHVGDYGLEGREMFTQTLRLDFPHNFYLCRLGCEALENHLKLRNYLCAHPEAVTRYGALKKSLAEEFPDDVDQYCAAKSELIAEFLLAAGMNSESVSGIKAINKSFATADKR